MYSSIYPQPTIIPASKGKNDIKFPQDIQVILRSDRPQYGNLYIGNIEAAENKMIIQNLLIGAILCVAKSYSTQHSKDLVQFSKYVPVEQSENAQIGQYLDECVNFINEKLKITNVLIHCVAGTNRSACFAIAFLIKFHNLTLEDAFNEVKSRRKIICPNENMIRQLKKYEKGLVSKNKNSNLIAEIRLNQPSTIYGGERSIRIKTNIFERSGLLDVEDRKSVNNSKMTNKIRLDDLDQKKSYKTNKSCSSKISNNNNAKHINISITQPNKMKNPQQSYISKHQKSNAVASALNKSFYANSQLNKSQITQFDHLPTEINLIKRSSGSREQFLQKVKQIDNKNNQINNKISYLHSKFESQHTNHKLALEAELNQITQLRSNINLQQSQRKSKFAERRQVHDKTMQNKQVEEYIGTLPLSTAKK